MTEVAIWNRLRSEQRLDPVRVGAAVVSGRVLFGAVGDDTRLEYTVIGDAVNLAAKLEKHTKIEQVRALTTDATYALARSQGYRELKPRRADVAVPGVDERLDLVVLA